MIDAILNNHLIYTAILLVLLLAVPALFAFGYGLRDKSRDSERRRQQREGGDRRA